MASVFSRAALGAGVLLACTALVAPAQAQFTASNNNGGTGFLTTASAPYTWLLVGTNNDAGNNFTFATATAGSAGSVTYNYAYNTGDIDGSSFDPGGYFINGNTFQLTANGSFATQSGSVVFNLNAGDSYGFYIYSTDGCCGPASIAFGQASVPEPASWAMMVGGFGLVGGAMRSRRKSVSFA